MFNLQHLKLFALGALLVAMPVGLTSAATGTPVIDGYLQPAGYTQLTSLASATGLGTIPQGTVLVLIQAESQNIRWRDDGTSPTASVGMIIVAGETLVYSGRPASLSLIEVTASAKANISFYK